eukprot:gene22791-31087_t
MKRVDGQQIWPREVNEFLQVSTRELKFDWNLIAQAVSSFIDRNSIHFDFEITAARCRMQFSEGFDHETFNNKLVDSISRKEVNEIGNEVEISAESTAEPERISKSFQESVEGLSLDELVLYVNEKEKQIEERKEILFKRILNSLSADSNSSTELIHDVVTSAYKQTIKAKEEAKRQKEKIEAENEENKRLLVERKKLKDRFAPDSEDQEGENPIPFIMQPVTSGKLDSFAEVEEIPAPNFEDIIDNDFDALLTELEHEYELLAPGKSDGTSFVNEELADVLQILDKAASTKKAMKENSEKASADRNASIGAVSAASRVATKNIETLPVTDSISSPVVSKQEHIPTLDEDSEGRNNDSSSESEEEAEESDENLDDWKESRAAIRSGVHRAASKEDTRTTSGKEVSRISSARVSKDATKEDLSGPNSTLHSSVPCQLSIAVKEEIQIAQVAAATVPLSHPSEYSELRAVSALDNFETVEEIDSFQDEEVPVLAVKVQSRSGSLLSGSRTMKATGRSAVKGTRSENIAAP